MLRRGLEAFVWKRRPKMLWPMRQSQLSGSSVQASAVGFIVFRSANQTRMFKSKEDHWASAWHSFFNPFGWRALDSVVGGYRDLSAEGRVRRVGLLEQKITCLLWNQKRLKGLLVPAENAPLPVNSGVEVLQSTSLEEAVMFCSFYEPGQAIFLPNCQPSEGSRRFVAAKSILRPSLDYLGCLVEKLKAFQKASSNLQIFSVN